jgi:DNA processing protein
MRNTSVLVEEEFERKPVSPKLELGAYEALWDSPRATFKTIAEKFSEHPSLLPSELVRTDVALSYATRAINMLTKAGVTQFGVRIHGAGEYPPKLRDARHPIEVLYYQGWWDLVSARSVAVVGTRKPSEAGVKRARRLTKSLVEDKFVVVSGLASGIDTVAHTTALEIGGLTIAVIGTPLSEVYPKENSDIQKRIAKDFLLISQVPIVRYSNQDYRSNRLFFPERNITMSALTEASIIVEAGETSGTLIQARAALAQGRKLFILDSCFQNPSLKWPHKYAEQGAIRIKDYEEIREHLVVPANQD